MEDDLAAAAPDIPLISCLAWIGIVSNPAGDVVTWKNADKLGAGLYPPASASRTFSAKEQAALDLWESLLIAGGANVVTTDNIKSMRYAKVSSNRLRTSISLS